MPALSQKTTPALLAHLRIRRSLRKRRLTAVRNAFQDFVERRPEFLEVLLASNSNRT